MRHLLQKLDELVGYKQQPEYQAAKKILGPDVAARGIGHKSAKRKTKFEEFALFLKDRGFQSMGNGSFGVVFSHPNLDYVIKVFKSDTPYLEYVRFCSAHKDNPHFPKFRGKIIHIDNDVYAVRMEKLEKLQGMYQRAMQALMYYCNSAGEYKWDDFVSELDKKDKLDIQELMARQPHLKEAIHQLFDFVQEADFGVSLDMHSGNSMMRGNTVVITDPFFDQDEF